MKCKDVSRLLDERELAQLSVPEMAELEAHVGDCAGCAEQCLASAQMASFRSEVPAMPASLQQQARELQERCDSGRAGTGTRRPVIIGSLFLLGAAATMFAAVPWSDTSTVNQ